MKPPVEFADIPDADHTLAGHEIEVAERVVEFLAPTLGPEPEGGRSLMSWARSIKHQLTTPEHSPGLHHK